ncbi:MAG: hypothetical protein MK119_15415 [Kordia sp.]|nr:hypothetical protein [Kordia sp.]
MKKNRSKSKLRLRMENISNMEKVTGGKTTNVSATVCDTALFISRFDDCSPPKNP